MRAELIGAGIACDGCGWRREGFISCRELLIESGRLIGVRDKQGVTKQYCDDEDGCHCGDPEAVLQVVPQTAQHLQNTENVATGLPFPKMHHDAGNQTDEEQRVPVGHDRREEGDEVKIVASVPDHVD